MAQSWGPSTAGQIFVSGVTWTFTIDGAAFSLNAGGRDVAGSALRLDGITIEPGTFWATINLPAASGFSAPLDGIPNVEAAALGRAVASAVASAKELERQQVEEMLRSFPAAIKPILTWAKVARDQCLGQLRARGWLGREFVDRMAGSKPLDRDGTLKSPRIVEHIKTLTEDVQQALRFWSRDFAEAAAAINQRQLVKELNECADFFATVERSPLTEEQARAVVCFDNRVLLVASAGSGKTSTMVAKAGYALRRKYFAPERILMLAFNNDAASELRERIVQRLGAQGLSAEKVVAKTFHAFGLEIVGQATGKRPSLAPWVESGRDLEALLEIVEQLVDTDSVFCTNWNLFRMVFGQDLPKFGKEADSPDAWDADARRQGFWTLNNEVVKSRGEQIIANWLFYNGVDYMYEAEYEHETADKAHRQYRPDFFLPQANAYLEHWALDDQGKPPADFVGYLEGVLWKRGVHQKHGTKLLETTMASLWAGGAFPYLTAKLAELGVTLAPDPDREIIGRRPIEKPRLARTFRSFLTHVKSNRLTMPELRRRCSAGAAGDFRFRHDMFLTLFEALSAAWERRLALAKCIDFEDMLNLAADCVERGNWSSPYELVMVDEFQDASHARARIIAGLVSSPDRYLFAVGDDWQSINRFAGADLDVMTEFHTKFGAGTTLKLETTFRCPQSLCAVSSRFIQKNAKQIAKSVRSACPDVEESIRIVRVPDETKILAAISARVDEILSIQDTSKKLSVFVLGRYNKDRVYLPHHDSARLKLEFITMHSSKGLEADHVIIPRMTSETLGFPSRVADDPVLQLAMPSGDVYEFAEERRLFYVAITRARSSVTLVTMANKESTFVTELVRDHKVRVQSSNGEASASKVCPSCGEGFLIRRKGRYGAFLGCTSFPRCTHTRKLR